MKKVIYLNNSKRNRGLEKKSRANKSNTEYIVLSIVVIHQVKGALGMPTRKLERTERALEIKVACTGNSNVTIDAAVITTVNDAITAYTNSLTGNRKDKYRDMVNSLTENLLAPFQKAANADPGNAVVILQSGKFIAVEPHIRVADVFSVENGTESGTILLTGPAGPDNSRHCHDWKHSPDGIAFTRMYPSTSNFTQLAGLIPGQWAYFTHELIIKDVPQGISQILKIMVK